MGTQILHFHTASAPKLPPISPINSGLAIALELILTLSAPASNTAAASSALRIPPPTVNGTNNAAARSNYRKSGSSARATRNHFDKVT